MSSKNEKSWIDRIPGEYVPWVGIAVAAVFSLVGILLFT